MTVMAAETSDDRRLRDEAAMRDDAARTLAALAHYDEVVAAAMPAGGIAPHHVRVMAVPERDAVVVKVTHVEGSDPVRGRIKSALRQLWPHVGELFLDLRW